MNYRYKFVILLYLMMGDKAIFHPSGSITFSKFRTGISIAMMRKTEVNNVTATIPKYVTINWTVVK